MIEVQAKLAKLHLPRSVAVIFLSKEAMRLSARERTIDTRPVPVPKQSLSIRHYFHYILKSEGGRGPSSTILSFSCLFKRVKIFWPVRGSDPSLARCFQNQADRARPESHTF